MSEPGSNPGGVLASLRRMGDSLLGLVQTRAELFALELEGEARRRLDLVVRLAVALAIGAMGLMLATAALALYLWETARYTGLLVAAGCFVGLSAVLVWRVREGARRGPKPLAATLAEFEKDRACLQGKD